MIDPKSVEAVLATFISCIQAHRQQSTKPYILGLSGLQGSGKSTWATALSKVLIAQYGIKTKILSLDDLYYDHADLVVLRGANPGNKLLQTRGQPGTHDETLATELFSKIQTFNCSENHSSLISWPAYDKSLHMGQGGRVPVDQWEKVAVSEDLDVLIFEGWCLGFKPLTDGQVTEKWKHGKKSETMGIVQAEGPERTQTLGTHDLDHLLLINNNLQRYCELFTGPQHFDGFLHLSTDELSNVYGWRLDQEKALRKHKPGMTDEQVVQFVKGYMPAYELFLERLQNENFFIGEGESGFSQNKHIQVLLNERREIVQIKQV